MSVTTVRYRVKPERVAENKRLVRAVYAELAALDPPGFRYTTFVAEDGVTFVHLAVVDDDGSGPLPSLPAFRAFVEEIGERCDEPPATVRSGEVIGAFGM